MMTSEQLEDLTRDPLAFFKGLSTWCHMQANQADMERGHEIPPQRNVWADTTALIDLTVALWQQDDLPADMWRRIMAGHLEQIRQTVQSY